MPDRERVPRAIIISKTNKATEITSVNPRRCCGTMGFGKVMIRKSSKKVVDWSEESANLVAR
jgi:hypothetical protein